MTPIYLLIAGAEVTVALDDAQRHTTLGGPPLDEGSARHRDLYLTPHNIHRHLCNRRDSNTQSKQPSGRRTSLRLGGHSSTLQLHKPVRAIKLASAGIIYRSPSCDNVATAMSQGHRQNTENDRFTSSYTVYREVLQSFKYINKSSIKYFIVYTCELFASERLILRKSNETPT